MPSRAKRDPETSLYAPVKSFLEAQGFQVKGEVMGCDIVAVRDGEPPLLIVAELKMTLSLELILQGVDRLRAANEVWLAVRRTQRGRDQDRRARRLVIGELKMTLSLDLVLQGVERMRAADEVWLAVRQSRKGRDTDRRAIRLCRLLGLGLLAVTASTGRVQILAEPSAYKPRADDRKRKLLLREHAARKGDPAIGGTTRQPLMTAYRQQALTCAAAMRPGPARPRDLKTQAPEAASILLRNVYGWFERVERGLYRLTETGEAALRRWPTA